MSGGLRRVSVQVGHERAEDARATMIELFPEGFEEVEQSARRRARGLHRRGRRGAALALLRRGAGRRRRGRLGGPLAHVPPADPHGPPLGRPAVGGSADRRARRRHRSRSRVRHRRASDDAALPRPAADESSRGSLLDVGCGSGVLSVAARAARVRAGARRRRRGAVDRGDARERAAQRRRARRAARRRTRTSAARGDASSRTSRVDAVGAAGTDRRRAGDHVGLLPLGAARPRGLRARRPA